MVEIQIYAEPMTLAWVWAMPRDESPTVSILDPMGGPKPYGHMKRFERTVLACALRAILEELEEFERA